MVSTLFTTVGQLEQAFHRREGRLVTRVATLAFQGFEQGCLFTADVGTGTRTHMQSWS